MLNFMKMVMVKTMSPYSRWMNKREFRYQPYSFNERPVEFAFVFRHLARLYPQKVLDVGTGTTALPHLIRNCGMSVTAIDNIKDYWTSGMYNRHYFVIDDDITNTRLDDKFNLITCVSVLEHITNFDAAICNMFNLLVPGGYLILTMPYTENKYVKNVYTLSGSIAPPNVPYTTQSYSRNELNRWLEDNGGVVVEQEYWQFWNGEFWSVGNKIIPPRKVNVTEKHQLSCLLLQKND